jgi:NADPH:quinone reductase-like Zn-dependent oxidoreductase
MRTALYRRYGGPEVIEIADVPAPTPSAHEVLIRVEDTSINPIDWKRGSGALRLLMPASFPLVPGYDVAGTVVACGSDANEFAVGARVHARISGEHGGASAEFVRAGLDMVAPIPDGMSFADAAALPLAGMTALQGLRDSLGLPLSGSSARVMVVGASGGVGHFAVQIAASTGAFVIGVCSATNMEMVKSLGAKQVIDYEQPEPFKGLAPVDLVLDCVGGHGGPYLPLLVDGGRYASPVVTPALLARQVLNPLSSKKELIVMLKANAMDLMTLDRLWVDKKLRVVTDSVFPMERLGEAWARSITGHAVGKVVVEIARA